MTKKFDPLLHRIKLLYYEAGQKPYSLEDFELAMRLFYKHLESLDLGIDIESKHGYFFGHFLLNHPKSKQNCELWILDPRDIQVGQPSNHWLKITQSYQKPNGPLRQISVNTSLEDLKTNLKYVLS